MKAWVVIPTYDACELVLRALESLAGSGAGLLVVDNGSTDGTAEAVAERFPHVRIVRNESNLGFGRAINRAALDLEGDALVLVNNDTVCEPGFVEHICARLAEPDVGMVAGILLLGSDPDLVDSAGIELDTTLRSWDALWNRPAAEIASASDPVGPCGGAAAYRLDVFRRLGGFDEALFAYWEDVDLALRFRAAGWRCVLARDARAVHHHGATLGAASPAQRRLEAFGRAYVLAKYRVAESGLLTRARIAALDWPVLAVHLLVRRELGPIRARARGARAGRGQPPHRAPLELATIGFRTALGRQWGLLLLRLTGRLPAHLHDHVPARTADTRAAPPSSRA